MSSFDPNEFLSTTFTDPTDTRKTPCPVGEYIASVEKVTPRVWESKDKSKAGVAFDVTWSVEDEGVRQELGKDKVFVRQSFMFNFAEGTNVIDTAAAKADVRFGKFRDAIGLNDGEFNWLMAIGKMARVKVEHEMYEGSPQDKVSAVTSL